MLQVSGELNFPIQVSPNKVTILSRSGTPCQIKLQFHAGAIHIDATTLEVWNGYTNGAKNPYGGTPNQLDLGSVKIIREAIHFECFNSDLWLSEGSLKPE